MHRHAHVARVIAALALLTGLGLASAATRAQSPAPPVQPVAPAATPAPAAADTAAEIAFWNSVKDSRSPAEIKAYLDKYPGGIFAGLARIRHDELVKAAARPTPAAPVVAAPAPPASKPPAAVASVPADTASALIDTATIREVQTKLYNLNYQLRTFTGQMNDETRRAIREWQAKLNLPATGDITTQQLATLRQGQVAATWGAIGYAARGASSAVWGRGTRADAERDALAECRKNGGGDCKVVTAAEKGCGALGFYTGKVGSSQHYGAYAIVRPTLGQATDSALAECRKQAKTPTACGVRVTFCADGSHKK